MDRVAAGSEINLQSDVPRAASWASFGAMLVCGLFGVVQFYSVQNAQPLICSSSFLLAEEEIAQRSLKDTF